MKAFVAVSTIALALPAVLCTLPTGISVGSGFGFPFVTLGGGTATGTAATGLAITGLSAGTALAAGLGGVAAAAGAGALAGLALRAATNGRRKRSVVSDEQVGEQFIFDALDAMDKHDCGKRYVCEIAATPVELLTQSELTSLLLFQTKSSLPESGKAKYDEAVRIGALSRSAKACMTRYATCPDL